MKSSSPVVKVFLDTNVLIDYVLSERPKHATALEVFHLIFSHRVEAAISTQSVLDAAYICKTNPSFSIEAFSETMLYMLDRINTGYVDPWDIETALRTSSNDIEDNAQISFAYNQGCDVIITSDKKFLSREMPRPMRVMTPEDFVNACRA